MIIFEGDTPMIIKVLRKVIRFIFLLGVVYLFFVALFIAFFSHATTSCGKLFEDDLVTINRIIQKEFNVQVIDQIDNFKFNCSSFMDRSLSAEFQLSKNDSDKLVEYMDGIYFSEVHRDNEYPFNTKMASKSKTEEIKGDYQYLEYVLPSFTGFYVKEVSVSISLENGVSHFNLNTYTW